ncbi:MAG: TetR/AcrR family transcriptional regulator [Myxococcales bacterium]
MARKAGSRNADYPEQRTTLARKVREVLMTDEGFRSSLRELAQAAGTSPGTLRHYFKDREGLVAAALETLVADAAPYVAEAAVVKDRDLRRSLGGYLAGIRTAWFRYGVGNLQARSLAHGLASKALGPAYVNYVLEPLLQSAETLLRRHVELGDLTPCDPRHAALELLSPVLLGLLHQDSLSGASCRPLDLDAFFADHVERFLKAFPPMPPKLELPLP